MGKCRECQNPLRIKEGGPKIIDGKIMMVQVMACMNPNCPLKMQEQDRMMKETPEFQG